MTGGEIDGNQELLFPVYYFSAHLGLIQNMVATWRHLGFFYNCLFLKRDKRSCVFA